MIVTITTEDDGTIRASAPGYPPCCEMGHVLPEAAGLHLWELMEALRPREARLTRELRSGRMSESKASTS